MSRKLNTKDSEETPKIMQPGNRVFKILSVELEKFPFKEGALKVIFNIEGPDLGKDFAGFNLDKNDPTKGKYKGQCGKIDGSEWAFADGETKGGTLISRDKEMLKFLKNLCKQTGKLAWLESQEDKHDTIESFYAQINKDKVFDNVWLRACVCGKEYLNKEGYTNYNLFLPKFTVAKVPFELDSIPMEQSKVFVFNEATHIVKKKAPTTVESFGDDLPKQEGPSGNADDGTRPVPPTVEKGKVFDLD
jgi:hypothetical protein